MIIFDPLHTIIDYGREPTRPPPTQITVSTKNFNLPVNCVLAGDPGPEEKKSRIVTDFRGILKGIFGE